MTYAVINEQTKISNICLIEGAGKEMKKELNLWMREHVFRDVHCLQHEQ